MAVTTVCDRILADDKKDPLPVPEEYRPALIVILLILGLVVGWYFGRRKKR